MKKNLQNLVLILCVIFSSAMSGGQPVTITLLHVNDTHSHLDAVGEKDASLQGTLGGIARAATVINSLRATEQNVLLLHAGDVFQGDPMFNTYFGVPEFEMMKQLGFDAMAVGNHEFDFGPGVLNDVLTTAFASGSFPLVSANLDMSAFPALKQWIQPSIIKNIAGVKIGIFGMTVPNNPTNMPDPVIVSDDVINIAQATVNDLLSNGADVVICLSHLGIFYDRMVAANTSGINFIIGGHDHFLFQQPEKVNNPLAMPVPIFQAGAHYKYIGKLHFTVENGNVTMNDYAIVNVDQSVQSDPTIQSVVDNLKQGVVAQFGNIYTTVIGHTNNELAETYDTSVPLRDTPLGNLITDAFQKKTGTDIAITPLGLISEQIYKGVITPADVFRSVSYGYDTNTGLGLQLATFNITGAELLKGMEICLSQLEVGDDFFLQFSGLQFRYDPGKSVGERVIISSVKINGKKISPAKAYSATVNTGVVGLLGMVGVNVTDINVLPDFEYNVVKDYIAALGNVNYHSQGRIMEMHASGAREEESMDAAAPDPQSIYNFPNPFNASTTFRFHVSESSTVELKIFDTAGKEVSTVVNSDFEKGDYRVEWTAKGLTAGIYFYKFITNDYSSTGRLSIIN